METSRNTKKRDDHKEVPEEQINEQKNVKKKNTVKNAEKKRKNEQIMKKQKQNMKNIKDIKNMKIKTLQQKQEEMLRIWYTNADTLTKDKIRELGNEIASDTLPDIIAITEFKPKNYIRELTQHDFKLNNYTFECENLTSKTSTRGVAFYIHKSIKYKRLKTNEVIGKETRNPKEMLTLDISLKHKNDHGLQITNIYRSPNNSKEVNRKTKYKTSTPELYKEKSKDCNNMTTSDSEKAGELEKYFSSVFVKEPDWSWDLRRNAESKKELNVNIKKEIIIKKLKNLDSNKAPGLDNLHPMIYKELF